MHRQPLVSILIPLYNKADFFEETMQSVLNQTYLNIEVIIVDDGSTDGSFELAKSYVSENVFLIKQANEGGSSARNKAFEYAKGDFIQYLDADDVLDVRKIEEQMMILRGQINVLASAKLYHFNVEKDGTWRKQAMSRLERNYDDMTDFLLDEIPQAMNIHAWLIPRNLVEKAGKWDETMTIFDDRDYYLRLVPNALRIIYCDDAICYWRLPNSSNHLSQRKNLSDYEAVLRYFTRFETFMLKDNLSNEKARTVLGCLYKKLLARAWNTETIVREILNRCMRLNLLPDCRDGLGNLILKRFLGVRLGFHLILLRLKLEKKPNTN